MHMYTYTHRHTQFDILYHVLFVRGVNIVGLIVLFVNIDIGIVKYFRQFYVFGLVQKNSSVFFTFLFNLFLPKKYHMNSGSYSKQISGVDYFCYAAPNQNHSIE